MKVVIRKIRQSLNSPPTQKAKLEKYNETENEWMIEINSLEELFEIIDTEGNVVIQKCPWIEEKIYMVLIQNVFSNNQIS